MKVMFVHGFLGSAPNWGPVMTKIRADSIGNQWELLAVDLLGHGRRGQDPIPRPFNLEVMAEDFERLVPPGEWILVGHSFGLRPVLRFADRHPSRVRMIVAEDTSPLLSDRGWTSLMHIFDRITVPFASREAARQALNAEFGMDTPMSKFLLSNIREVEPGRHDWRFNHGALRELLASSRGEALWQEWESFAGPLHMILGGEKTSYVGAERLQECLQRRAGKVTTWTRIEDSGHWVHSDQPALFVEDLIRAIRELANKVIKCSDNQE